MAMSPAERLASRNCAVQFLLMRASHRISNKPSRFSRLVRAHIDAHFFGIVRFCRLRANAGRSLAERISRSWRLAARHVRIGRGIHRSLPARRLRRLVHLWGHLFARFVSQKTNSANTADLLRSRSILLRAGRRAEDRAEPGGRATAAG